MADLQDDIINNLIIFVPKMKGGGDVEEMWRRCGDVPQ